MNIIGDHPLLLASEQHTRTISPNPGIPQRDDDVRYQLTTTEISSTAFIFSRSLAACAMFFIGRTFL